MSAITPLILPLSILIWSLAAAVAVASLFVICSATRK